MKEFDFSVFRNVTITETDMNTLSTEESSVLYRQAEYCQAMTEADIDDGNLDYHTIGIENPAIEANEKRGVHPVWTFLLLILCSNVHPDKLEFIAQNISWCTLPKS